MKKRAETVLGRAVADLKTEYAVLQFRRNLPAQRFAWLAAGGVEDFGKLVFRTTRPDDVI